MNAGKAFDTIVGILVAIVGVAILSLLVARQSQTPQVLKAAGTALGGIISSAIGSV